MIDKKWIGHELPAKKSELTLERGRLRAFAKAIGETDPSTPTCRPPGKPVMPICRRRRPSCSRPSSTRAPRPS
jgi:hypothetical protein